MNRLAVLALLVFCGCGDAKPSATPTADTGQDTSADTASVAADAPEVAVADASHPDAQSDTAVAPGADHWCGTFATAACSSAKTCCKGAPPANCETVWQKACAKAGFSDLDDAILAAKVTLADADKSACLQALHTAAGACDKQGLGRALAMCLRSWRDPATLDQNCAAPVDVPCAGGKGRCSAKTPDLYVCTQAATAGQACSATVPCAVGLECLDGTLTRAKTCGTPGSTCNLADKCWDGWGCDNGTCKKQDKLAPASCADDAACPGSHLCSGGVCVAKLCLP